MNVIHTSLFIHTPQHTLHYTHLVIRTKSTARSAATTIRTRQRNASSTSFIRQRAINIQPRSSDVSAISASADERRSPTTTPCRFRVSVATLLHDRCRTNLGQLQQTAADLSVVQNFRYFVVTFFVGLFDVAAVRLTGSPTRRLSVHS